MIKTKKWKIMLMGTIAMLVLLALFLFAVPVKIAVALEGDEITSTDMPDVNLKNALINIYNNANPNNQINTLYSDCFEGFIELNFASVPHIKITNLQGLELFDFSSVETLNLSNNEISDIEASHLTPFINLKNLNLSKNSLKSISVSLACLEKIDLSHNKLSSINLNFIKTGEVDLSFNKFERLTNINFNSSSNNLSVNLLNNNFKELENFEINGVNFELGLQGVNLNESEGSVKNNSTLRVYNTKDNIHYTFVDSNDNNVKVVNNSESESYTDFTLPVGKYTLKFLDKDGNVVYSDLEIKVLPNTPLVKVLINGKLYDGYDKKVSGKQFIMVYTTAGAQVSFKVAGEQTSITTANEEGVAQYRVTKGGRYNLTVTVTDSGITSDSVSVNIITSVNPNFPDIVLWLIITAGAVVLLIGIALVKKYVI